MFPKSQVLTRTYNISTAERSGTAFALDVDARQYLITAKHVVQDIQDGDSLSIFHAQDWHSFGVRIIGVGPGEIDVAVLRPPFRLATLPLPYLADHGLTIGQDAYFTGFPLNQRMDHSDNTGFPLPFVKQASLAAITDGKIYLDGVSASGMSGAPIVFESTDGTPYVAAVLKGGQTMRHKVTESEGAPIDDVEYEYPAGIIEGYLIFYALDLIRDNPTGLGI